MSRWTDSTGPKSIVCLPNNDDVLSISKYQSRRKGYALTCCLDNVRTNWDRTTILIVGEGYGVTDGTSEMRIGC